MQYSTKKRSFTTEAEAREFLNKNLRDSKIWYCAKEGWFVTWTFVRLV